MKEKLFALSCWLLALALALPCCAQSVDFNGSNSIAQHTTADVLNSQKTVTLVAWVRPDTAGETNGGTVLQFDEANGNARWALAATTTNRLQIFKTPGAAGTTGFWTVPYTVGESHWVIVEHDFSGDNNPNVWIDGTSVTVTVAQAPVGINDQPATGYSVGAIGSGALTWDGLITYLQVFNRTGLTAAERVQCMNAPGTVSSGLRLYLPMTNSTDINDGSGNGFNATGSNLVTGAEGPRRAGILGAAVPGLAYEPLRISIP